MFIKSEAVLRVVEDVGGRVLGSNLQKSPLSRICMYIYIYVQICIYRLYNTVCDTSIKALTRDHAWQALCIYNK